MSIIVTLQEKQQENQNDNVFLLLPEENSHLNGVISRDWFEKNFWEKNNAIIGHSVGRNVTWFVTYQEEDWVLRHYYRGGMIARILQDRYWFSKIENTRSYRELLLLEQMHLQGLPVPKPVAARVIKQGLFYRADLLIEKIPNAEDMVQKLQSDQLIDTDWHSLGAMIADFHRAGIYHSDLNAHNILLDKSSRFWLIDFDKCDQRKPEKGWQQNNLNRLHRSFEKEKGLHTVFQFNEQCWQRLTEGYQKSAPHF